MRTEIEKGMKDRKDNIRNLLKEIQEAMKEIRKALREEDYCEACLWGDRLKNYAVWLTQELEVLDAFRRLLTLA